MREQMSTPRTERKNSRNTIDLSGYCGLNLKGRKMDELGSKYITIYATEYTDNHKSKFSRKTIHHSSGGASWTMPFHTFTFNKIPGTKNDPLTRFQSATATKKITTGNTAAPIT
mmetsp:Transcript_20956/g.26514  ORF Transcript_20956/g.26514 Transcript_20956/m.26514 type:complete len:114 (-) Transcript_20956:941-1282(-)